MNKYIYNLAALGYVNGVGCLTTLRLMNAAATVETETSRLICLLQLQLQLCTVRPRTRRVCAGTAGAGGDRVRAGGFVSRKKDARSIGEEKKEGENNNNNNNK